MPNQTCMWLKEIVKITKALAKKIGLHLGDLDLITTTHNITK